MPLSELHAAAQAIRRETIRCIGSLGVGHIGGSLSLSETLAVLYFDHMHIDPSQPDWSDRDYLILSKGHAGPALYATLALKGYFPLSVLDTLNRPGTSLPSHCDRLLTTGVDMTAGSLGQGLGNAVGLALGWRLTGKSNRVFVILGDGEMNEGSVWESLMAVSHFKLDAVNILIDRNRLQSDGATEEIMSLEPLQARLAAFGCTPLACDGHDVAAIHQALNTPVPAGHPRAVILNTIKGKGYPGEGEVGCHNFTLDPEVTTQVLRDMEVCS